MFCMLVRNKIMGKFLIFFIVYFILCKINNHLHNLFDLTSLVHENYSYSLDGGHMRLVVYNRSEDAKKVRKMLANVLFY